MLKDKVTLISLGVIAIAVIVFLFSISKDKKSKNFHDFIDPNEIKEITLRKENKIVLLTSSSKNKWHISDNNKFKIDADSTKILSIFNFISDSKIIQKVTKKQNSYAKFDLSEDKRLTISALKKKGGKYLVYAGKNKDYSSQFVRKEGDPYVYLISKNLNASFERESWFYKKILNFDFDEIDHISYTTDSNKILKIFYEKISDKLFLKESPPSGKQTKDLKWLKNSFTGISISKYISLPHKKHTGVTSHTIYLKDGGTIKLAFSKSKDKNASKNYLRLEVEGKDFKNPDIKYIKDLSQRYMFELSWFDKAKYQKKYADFFEIKPEKKKEEKKADNIAETIKNMEESTKSAPE